MAYRFKKNEAIPHALQRVFAEEISWAVGQLTHSKKRVEAVHEARKSIKKIRGLVSLVAEQLGPAYKAQDRHFRDAGRLLSDVRDNAVILQVFDALAAEHPEMDAGEFAQVRSNLQRSQAETRSEKGVSSEVVRSLEQAQVQVKSWPLQNLQFEQLLPALSATYRAGRKALKRAQKDESTESLHELRKKVKQHWYHLRLFETPGMKDRLADLRDLETALGDFHNLSVLRERLTSDSETSRDRQQTRQFIALLDQEALGLREHSLESAERLYSGKASSFCEHLAAQWMHARKAAASSSTHAKTAVA